MIAGLSVLEEIQKRCRGGGQVANRGMEDEDGVDLGSRGVVVCSADMCWKLYPDALVVL